MKAYKNLFFLVLLASMVFTPLFGQGSSVAGGEPVRTQNLGQGTLPTAQIRTQNLTRSAEFFNILRNTRSVDERGLPTIGSVYINADFQPCKVYYLDEFVGDFVYRHNAYNDEIEIRSTNLADTTISSLLINRNIRVRDNLTNKRLGVMTFLSENQTLRNGYLYSIVNEGKYRLFYKNQVKFTEGTVPANSFNRPTPNRFTHFKRYFLKVDDKDIAFQLDKSKSSLLKNLPKEDREKAKAFMKENKISMKDEQDLTELINYLNTL